MSADAAVLAAVNALAQSPLRPGVLDDVQDVASVAALRKQVRIARANFRVPPLALRDRPVSPPRRDALPPRPFPCVLDPSPTRSSPSTDPRPPARSLTDRLPIAPFPPPPRAVGV